MDIDDQQCMHAYEAAYVYDTGIKYRKYALLSLPLGYSICEVTFALFRPQLHSLIIVFSVTVLFLGFECKFESQRLNRLRQVFFIYLATTVGAQFAVSFVFLNLHIDNRIILVSPSKKFSVNPA